MDSNDNIFRHSILDSVDSLLPLERARLALRAARQYQEDWVKHGGDRVYLYLEEVEEDPLRKIPSLDGNTLRN
jgi:hypothetical protein